MNKKLYVIYATSRWERAPFTLCNIATFRLKPLSVCINDLVITNNIKVIFNMYRFGSKEFDKILDMLKSEDKDSYNLALGILRSNNCIIYEKGT